MSSFDMTSFERDFEQRMQAYSAVQPRRFDPNDIARRARDQNSSRPRYALPRLQLPTLAPAYAWLILALLAALLTALVVGAYALRHDRSTTGPGANGDIMFLAFSSDPANFQTNTIHLIAPDGTDDRLLAQGDSADYSADGSTIVFATVPSTGPLAGFPRLMVSDADGSNMRVVTSSAFGAYAISPDGSRVLVASPSRGDQSPATNRVWIVDLANGTERDLNLTTGDPSTSFENFVWSPDGKSVAFAEIRHVSLATEQGHSRTAYRTAIDVVDLTQATPHAVRVSERPGSASVAIGWSPDSQALAFTGYPDGVAPPTPPLPSPETPGVPDPTQDIFVADLTTGTETNLTNSDSDEYNPRWSPDGKALAYLTGTDTHYVATQPMSGFQPEGGPSVGAMANDFVWSPDGKSLLLAQIIETNNDAGGSGQAAALHGFLQIVQTSNVVSPATLLQSSEAINTVRWQWRPRP